MAEGFQWSRAERPGWELEICPAGEVDAIFDVWGASRVWNRTDFTG